MCIRDSTQESSYNVVSTGFTIEGVTGTVYLSDEVIDREKGRIFFFTYEEGGTPNIIKKNAGTVDYIHGEILIDTVNILSTVIANNIHVQDCAERSAEKSSTYNLVSHDGSNKKLSAGFEKF